MTPAREGLWRHVRPGPSRVVLRPGGSTVPRTPRASSTSGAGRVDEAASTELAAHDPLRWRLRDSQVRTLAESAPPVTDPARTTPRSDLLR
ncbi:hypothetical protein [Cellulomonas sp.]|uniref:hypothetical protein n=1 Tax=Cellulomonas sp. TaxID=40001 RepID=UPI002D2C4FFC|nr:hypothetical protein [Cellulomonas sp.]HYQ77397.1 hypothetical protein [Cellulomonas sp.]